MSCGPGITIARKRRNTVLKLAINRDRLAGLVVSSSNHHLCLLMCVLKPRGMRGALFYHNSLLLQPFN